MQQLINTKWLQTKLKFINQTKLHHYRPCTRPCLSSSTVYVTVACCMM